MHAATLEAPLSTLPESVPTLEVSVVMPCLNEARTVGRCVAKAVRLPASEWASAAR